MFKVVTIKWDFNDEEWNDTVTISTKKTIFEHLPKEVSIPEKLLAGYDGTNFDTYYPDVSDWLTNKYGFNHFGFELKKC